MKKIGNKIKINKGEDMLSVEMELLTYGVQLTPEQLKELEDEGEIDLSSNSMVDLDLNQINLSSKEVEETKEKTLVEVENNLVVGNAIADLIEQGYVIKEAILRRQYSSVLVKIQEGMPNRVVRLSGLPIKVLNKIAKEMTPFSTAMDSREYQELKLQEKGEEMFMQFTIEDETYPHPFILKLKLIQNNFQEEDISW